MKGSLGQRLSSDWWMSAEWVARDEHPILPTSTNPYITRAAGTKGGGLTMSFMSGITCKPLWASFLTYVTMSFMVGVNLFSAMDYFTHIVVVSFCSSRVN